MSVSDAARELAILRIGVGDLTGVCHDRVEALRAVMAEGRYSADLESVARDFLRELLGELLA